MPKGVCFDQGVVIKIIISWFSWFPWFLQMLGFIVLKGGYFQNLVVSVVLVVSRVKMNHPLPEQTPCSTPFGVFRSQSALRAL